MHFDLVLLSIGGVQRFIAESRTTADVAGASEIVQRLAKGAAAVIQHRLADVSAPSGLIFPTAADAESVTNKIVFLAPGGDGPTAARGLFAATFAQAWAENPWWSQNPWSAQTLEGGCADLNGGHAEAPVAVLVLMTGWSLAVGLAAQILWDDRPVTAPLGRLRRVRGATR